MVTKSRKSAAGEKEEKKGRVRVNKLKLNKETISDLTGDETRQVKGGVGMGGGRTGSCVAGQGIEPQPINRPGQSAAGDPICD